MGSESIAIILAAGRGSRLRPHTDLYPKCLVLVAGLPILHRQLKALEAINVKDVILVIGYLGEGIRSYVEKHFPHFRFVFIQNNRFADSNNFFSLSLVVEHPITAETIYQLNCDVVFDPKILQELSNLDPQKSFSATEYKICGEEEIKVSLDSEGRIKELNKKIFPPESIGEAVGIHKYSNSFWNQLSVFLKKFRNEFKNEYYERGIEETIQSGASIFPWNVDSFYVKEIDFPEDLTLAEEAIKKAAWI